MALITDKLIFVHVPRTGGHFVRSVINELRVPFYEDGDSALPNIIQFHQPAHTVDKREMEFKFSFGFVRHPMTWLVSRWWCETQYNMPRTDNRRTIRGLMSDSFYRFLDQVVVHCPEIPSVEMLGILSGVDKVYRYENLIAATIAALTEAGYDVAPHLIERLPRWPNECAMPLGVSGWDISPEQRRIIMEANKELCEAYRYE